MPNDQTSWAATTRGVLGKSRVARILCNFCWQDRPGTYTSHAKSKQSQLHGETGFHNAAMTRRPGTQPKRKCLLKLAKVKARLLLEFKKKDMIMIPRTRGFRNGGFVVRVNVL